MGTRASGGGPPVPNHSAGRGTPTEALRGRGAARPHGIPVRPNAPHDDLDPIFSPSGLSSAPFTPVSPSGPPEDRTQPQHGTVRLWNVPSKALSDPNPSPTSAPFTPIRPTAACSTPGSLTLPSRARCAPLPPSPTPWLLFQSPPGCGCALTSLWAILAPFWPVFGPFWPCQAQPATRRPLPRATTGRGRRERWAWPGRVGVAFGYIPPPEGSTAFAFGRCAVRVFNSLSYHA